MNRAASALVLLAQTSCFAMIDDPAPGFLVSLEESRKLVCEPTTLEVLRREHPGLIDEAKPRGDFADRNANFCAELVFPEGTRHPRDAATLRRLAATMAEVADQLADERPDAERRTWLVESHYPDAAMAAKIAFAAKAALVEKGLTVSDRLPTLAVGDIDVIASMSPLEAHALACRRYFAPGRLRDSEAVLGLVVLDRRETSLHAGTCEGGQWTWLR